MTARAAVDGDLQRVSAFDPGLGVTPGTDSSPEWAGSAPEARPPDRLETMAAMPDSENVTIRKEGHELRAQAMSVATTRTGPDTAPQTDRNRDASNPL